MLAYFVRRFLIILPKLLLILILIFAGMELMPGDAFSRTIDPAVYENMTEQQIKAMKESMGIDQPAPIRFIEWIGGMLRGDFGTSLVTGKPVTDSLRERFPATLELAAAALIISTVLGLLAGFVSSIHKNTLVDYSNSFFGLIGISVPTYFFCMMFIIVFAIQMRWFPSGGRMAYGVEGLARLKFLVLPATVLSIEYAAGLMRLTRNTMLDVMNKDYIKTARAKGQEEGKVFLGHVFRNGCAPVVMTLIYRLGLLIGGTAIIEMIFSWPGIGTLILTAISSKDAPVAMAILTLTSAFTLFATFLVDIALALIDPRVRYGKEGQ